MNENQNTTDPAFKEDVNIDLVETILIIWKHRKWVAKYCGFSLLIGLVIVFSIPKEYISTATIAPETTQNKGGGLSSIAAMAGFNLNSSSSIDAISPDIYPNIVKSTPFITGLFNVPVKIDRVGVDTTLYSYLYDFQRVPWWNVIITAPKKTLLWCINVFREEQNLTNDHNSFTLTIDENTIAQNLSERIAIQVDKNTGLIYLSVRMQDAKISAAIADTLINNLQEYITKYRTNKARQDFIFQQELYLRKKKEYEIAQSNYTKFVDTNNNIILMSYKAEQIRLEQEMNLAYQVYSSVAQQLQLAEAKVQEITPVYSIVEPAIVPIYASKPNKPLILAGIFLLTFMSCSFWIVFGKGMLTNIKQKKKHLISVKHSSVI